MSVIGKKTLKPLWPIIVHNPFITSLTRIRIFYGFISIGELFLNILHLHKLTHPTPLISESQNKYEVVKIYSLMNSYMWKSYKSSLDKLAVNLSHSTKLLNQSDIHKTPDIFVIKKYLKENRNCVQAVDYLLQVASIRLSVSVQNI